MCLLKIAPVPQVMASKPVETSRFNPIEASKIRTVYQAREFAWAEHLSVHALRNRLMITEHQELIQRKSQSNNIANHAIRVQPKPTLSRNTIGRFNLYFIEGLVYY